MITLGCILGTASWYLRPEILWNALRGNVGSSWCGFSWPCEWRRGRNHSWQVTYYCCYYQYQLVKPAETSVVVGIVGGGSGYQLLLLRQSHPVLPLMMKVLVPLHPIRHLHRHLIQHLHRHLLTTCERSCTDDEFTFTSNPSGVYAFGFGTLILGT